MLGETIGPGFPALDHFASMFRRWQSPDYKVLMWPHFELEVTICPPSSPKHLSEAQRNGSFVLQTGIGYGIAPGNKVGFFPPSCKCLLPISLPTACQLPLLKEAIVPHWHKDRAGLKRETHSLLPIGCLFLGCVDLWHLYHTMQPARPLLIQPRRRFEDDVPMENNRTDSIWPVGNRLTFWPAEVPTLLLLSALYLRVGGGIPPKCRFLQMCC